MVKVQKAVEGCTYIVHSATPVPMVLPKNKEEEDALIQLACEGTLNIMRASL